MFSRLAQTGVVSILPLFGAVACGPTKEQVQIAALSRMAGDENVGPRERDAAVGALSEMVPALRRQLDRQVQEVAQQSPPRIQTAQCTAGDPDPANGGRPRVICPPVLVVAPPPQPGQPGS